MTDEANEQKKKTKISWEQFVKFQLVLAILFLIMFTMRSTVNILQVFVPALEVTFDKSTGTIQLLFTIYNITAAIVSLFIGALTEKIGYKIIMYSGLAIFAAGTLLAAFSISYPMIAVAQVLAGAGSAGFGPAVIAYAGDYFPLKKRVTAIGLIMSSFYLANIIAVPINAYLEDYLNWRWPVGIMAVFGFLVFVLVLFFIPGSRTKIKDPLSEKLAKNKASVESIASSNDVSSTVQTEKSAVVEVRKGYFKQMRVVFGNKYAVGTFCITLFQRGGLFAMTALLSKWLTLEPFKFSETKIGLVFLASGIASLVSNSFFSWIADKVGKRAIIIVGTSLTAVWIGVFPLISINGTIAVISVVILNFFGGISMGSYNAFVAEVIPVSKATTVAVNNTFGQISQAGATALLGRLIFDLTQNYFYCGLAAAGIYLIAIILMFIFVRPRTIAEISSVPS